MGCRAQPVRYPISRTVQQMTRETRMGQPSYTEFRILPRRAGGLRDLASIQTTLASPGMGAVFDLPWTPLFILVLFLFQPLPLNPPPRQTPHPLQIQSALMGKHQD